MQFEVGTVLEGKVTGITNFGAFVELEGGKTGMVHISEVASTYVSQIRDHVSVGQTVKVKVLNIGDDGKISLSMKRAEERTQQQAGSSERGNNNRQGGRGNRQSGYEYRQQARPEPSSFDEMLSRFMATSDEKMGDLRRGNEGRRTSRKGQKQG